MRVPVACLAAAALSVLAIQPVWAISAQEVLSLHDRWRPGEGLRAGDWYTYMVCDAAGGCGIMRLDFHDVGQRWNATVGMKEIPVPDGAVTQDDVMGYMDGIWDIYGLPPHSLQPRFLNMTVNPAGLNVQSTNHEEREIADRLDSTMFFLGGEIRLRPGHDPILEVGRLWPYQGAAFADPPLVITDVFNGYESCGSSLNSTAYSIVYRNSAKVDMLIADGFPFPVAGTALGADGSAGHIYGDPHIVRSNWYMLVEHSGGLGDPGMGPACSIAAAMRDAGTDAEPEEPAILDDVREEVAESGGVTVRVPETLYREGDSIRIYGNITEPLPGYPPVGITISNHEGTVRSVVAPFNHLNEYDIRVDADMWAGGPYVLEAGYGSASDTAEFMVLGEWSTASFGNLTDIVISGFDEDARYRTIGGNVSAIWGYGEEISLVLYMEADTDGAVLLEIPADLARFIGGSALRFVAFGDHEPLDISTLYSGDTVGVVVDFGAGVQEIEITGAWER